MDHGQRAIEEVLCIYIFSLVLSTASADQRSPESRDDYARDIAGLNIARTTSSLPQSFVAARRAMHGNAKGLLDFI